MDFLKKHYEKIILAAALVFLIASAIYLALKVSALNSELSEVENHGARPQLTPHVALATYSNAIHEVQNPPTWDTNVYVRVFDQRAPAPKVLAIDPASLSNNLPILVAVVHKPFTLLFK